ncbi:GNAT family N-acetyltransferase [Limosilactobacillus mucosae]|uniref:GNAT family N-acetyltransferase n=1 Tax=Limosilactobacillus mucosae TaxID=97478 RepID=UPI0022E60EDF|nr:GNAT family N-acetyltransferase [Limosilactobacillus mucosae]
MNNQITLAYLDYDDLDALQVVSVVSFYESFIDGADPLDMQRYLQTQLTTEILAVELAQSTSKFIGIKDHQILIGYMKVNDEKDAIEIQRLYLLKDYQNKGLGQRLLDEANHYAKTKQKRYLRLGVYEKNYAGIRFYERHGFKKIGIKHFPLGKQDRICPILEKEI